MASKFFRGFSKVFKGPNNRDGFKRPTKYATIGGVKPKAKTSYATKKFKARVAGIKSGVKRGTDDFKKENPKSLVTDKQIKNIQKETSEKHIKRVRKEYLREKKSVGGIAKKITKPSQPPRKQEGQKRKPNKLLIVIDDGKPETREKKSFGGLLGKKKKSKKPTKPSPDSIKEKILPKKKKDRLDELRKDLGLKKGGSALKPVDKQKNPGLAKLPTQVRNKMGYMRSGGPVKQAAKTITSPKTILRNIKSKRKFGGGKK